MKERYGQNNLPFSVKGKKKLLAPLSAKNTTNTSISTKESFKGEKDPLYSSREKFEIDCNNDKKEDAIFLAKLSEREKFFYEVNAKEIYDFLKSINLIRFIESFINDGFETKEDLMEIQEDYFEENKSFNQNQQKKILSKAKEYLNEYNKNNIEESQNKNGENHQSTNSLNIDSKKTHQIINETTKKEKGIVNRIDTGCGGDINDYQNNATFNRCWTCFNKLKDKNFIEIKYEDSIVTRIVRFCSQKCKFKFEENIFETCDYCFTKYDKSKGDFICNNKHFDSKECSESFMKENYGEEGLVDKNININKNKQNFKENKEKVYDPMDDF